MGSFPEIFNDPRKTRNKKVKLVLQHCCYPTHELYLSSVATDQVGAGS